MSVKLSASLPQEYDHNGMERLHGELVKRPSRRHVVVMVLDCARTTVEHHAGEERYTPTAGIVFAEPLRDDDDIDAVLDIVGRVRAERIGDGTLDFDFGVGVDPFTKAADDLRRASGIRTEGTATDA